MQVASEDRTARLSPSFLMHGSGKRLECGDQLTNQTLQHNFSLSLNCTRTYFIQSSTQTQRDIRLIKCQRSLSLPREVKELCKVLFGTRVTSTPNFTHVTSLSGGRRRKYDDLTSTTARQKLSATCLHTQGLNVTLHAHHHSSRSTFSWRGMKHESDFGCNDTLVRHVISHSRLIQQLIPTL